MKRSAKYLYYQNEVREQAAPSRVNEYLVPTKPDHHSSSSALDDTQTSMDDLSLHPDFLYAKNSRPEYVPPPRVVEFYAPWCSHCQHYAPRYVALAEAVYAIQPSIVFHAVSCVAHRELCKVQNVTAYPMIKLYREGSYEARQGKKGNDVKTILKELGFDDGGVSGGDGVGSANAESSRKLEETRGEEKTLTKESDARVVPFQINDVHYAWTDAALSFEFALRNSIYVENGPLNATKSRALREWLTLLSTTLPPQMTRTNEIIDTLLKNLDIATGGQSGLNDLVTLRVGPTEPTWSWRTCTYGDGAVGYTCGLWQLFHIMSIGVVEYNQHTNTPMPTRYVADTLREYIDHFFQCEVCRLNFLWMYNTCAFDGCNRLSDKPSLSNKEWRELPLWLWETHNDVNVRLMSERLERNEVQEPDQWESQQARWPSLYLCPNCWRDEAGTKSWDEVEVYKYLRNSYWAGNPSYIQIPSSYESSAMSSWSRIIPLRLKLAAVTFAAVALLRMYNSKKRKRPEYTN